MAEKDIKPININPELFKISSAQFTNKAKTLKRNKSKINPTNLKKELLEKIKRKSRRPKITDPDDLEDSSNIVKKEPDNDNDISNIPVVKKEESQVSSNLNKINNPPISVVLGKNQQNIDLDKDDDFLQSIEYLKKVEFPIVIKADGLAAGKGVYICKDMGNASEAVEEIFNGKFGKAEKIVIEEFLEGEEMSFFIISDGKTFKKFNTAQDHKRVGVGDTGKNTGGMGAYTPSGLINQELENKIINKIINPTLKALNDINEEYIGFLYAGLMIKDNEPYLIEYNVRMGDPECQTILPLLKSDFLEIILACCDGKLDEIDIQWSDKKSLCIVLCSKGYPDTYEKNIEISGLDKLNLEHDSFIFHAGTTIKNDKTIVNGGRVLNFVSISDNYLTSRNTIIDKIEKLNWSGGFYRSDIGFKIIK